MSNEYRTNPAYRVLVDSAVHICRTFKFANPARIATIAAGRYPVITDTVQFQSDVEERLATLGGAA